jgi:hypothetical protein
VGNPEILNVKVSVLLSAPLGQRILFGFEAVASRSLPSEFFSQGLPVKSYKIPEIPSVSGSDAMFTVTTVRQSLAEFPSATFAWLHAAPFRDVVIVRVGDVPCAAKPEIKASVAVNNRFFGFIEVKYI